MSYSNRPSKRPDPTIAPVVYNPVTKQYELRDPFTESTYHQKKREAAKEARKRNRKGVAYHGRGG